MEHQFNVHEIVSNNGLMERLKGKDIYEVLNTLFPEVKKIVLEYIRVKYECEPVASKRCVFHISRHTEAVVQRVESAVNEFVQLEILKEESKYSSSDLLLYALLCKYAALFHDIVQEFIVETAGNGKHYRTSNVRYNETESADQLVSFLREIDTWVTQQNKQHAIRLEESHFQDARKMILNTIPAYNSDFGSFTRFQLASSKDANFFMSVVPIADLASMGIDEYQAHEDGNAVFVERELWITEILESSMNWPFLNKKMTEILDAYAAWEKNEVSFLMGRKRAFYIEILHLSEEEQSLMKECFFQRVDRSIAYARQQSDKWNNPDGSPRHPWTRAHIEFFLSEVMRYSQDHISKLLGKNEYSDVENESEENAILGSIPV